MSAQYQGDRNYLTGSLIENIQAEAIIKYSIAGVTRKLVRAAVVDAGNTITFPTANIGTNAITSADVTSHTDSDTEITASFVNTDKKTVTPAMYAVRIDQFDSVELSSSQNPASYWGGLMGNAISALVDSTLNALFDGFTDAVGTSTVGVTFDNLNSALKYLKSYNAQGQPYWVAPSGAIWGSYGIVNDIVGTGNYAGSAQDEALRNAFVARVAGLEIYHSEEFTESDNATKSGIFVRDALGYGVVRQGGGEFKVESDRNILKLRTQWVGSIFMGAIEIYDYWGVEVHTKTS